MTAQCGSAIVVSMKDGSGSFQVVAGLRTRRVQINAEMVDVTNADSVGRWRELLDGCGVRSASISGDGVFTDDAGLEAVRSAIFGNSLREAKIFLPGFGTFDAMFKVTQLESAGDYNNAETFSMTFESAGEMTFTSN